MKATPRYKKIKITINLDLIGIALVIEEVIDI